MDEWDWLIHEQNRMERDGYEFYYPLKSDCEREKSQKKALLLTHQLSRSGAPLALYLVGEYLQKEGWQVIFLSPEDGVLKEDLLKQGFPVILCGKYWNRKIPFQHFGQLFDIVVVNTLLHFPAVMLLEERKCKVVWWIHEMDDFFELGKDDLPLIADLKENVQVLAAGGFVQNCIEKYLKSKVPVLNVGVEEIHIKRVQPVLKKRFHFACVGIIAGYKGQYVLLEALLLLPKEYQEKITVSFVGENKGMSTRVKALIEKCKGTPLEVIVQDNMAREKLFEYYKKVDCLVVPSRLEALSMVGVEAMELEIPVICSTGAGLSQYISHKYTRYLFPNLDCKELADQMIYVMNNKEEMEEVGRRGREIFLKHFSMDVFEHNIRKWMMKGEGE